MNSDNIKKIVCIIFLMMLNHNCSQPKKYANMKWISKYDFYDLYQKNINGGFFPPGTGLNLKIFKFLDENTIFLAGSKDLHDFYNKSGDTAVLFVSNDRGKIYREITFPEENVTSVNPAEKYTIVETNIKGYSTMGKNCIYLLDNMTLKYQKIDEYSSNEDKNYNQFDGKNVILSYNKSDKVINVFTKEEHILPKYISELGYKLESDLKVVFLKDNQIIRYDIKNKKESIIKKLNKGYDFLDYNNGDFLLAKSNFLKTQITVYNENENELYIENKKTGKYYRYKNFACYYKETRPYVTFCYSYDYGKTWYEYKTEKFFTTITPKGYYKDKFMLLDVCFYDKKDKTNIMVGEFQK